MCICFSKISVKVDILFLPDMEFPSLVIQYLASSGKGCIPRNHTKINIVFFKFAAFYNIHRFLPNQSTESFL